MVSLEIALIVLFVVIIVAIFIRSTCTYTSTSSLSSQITDVCYPISNIITYNETEDISLDCNTFRVGMHVNIDPEAGFAFTQDNCLRGYDVAVSQLIADQLGKRLVIVDVPFYLLIEALQAGKIDMIASQMNITRYRSQRIAQIAYHPSEGTTYSLAMTTTLANELPSDGNYIATLNERGQGGRVIRDNSPNRALGIAVPPGTIQENYLLTLKRANMIPNLNVVLIDNTEEAVSLLKSGYVVGYLTDAPVARDDPDITNVTTPITLPEEQVGPFGLGINIQCCNMINRVWEITRNLEENGSLPNLARQYLDPQENLSLTITQPQCQDITRRCVSCF